MSELKKIDHPTIECYEGSDNVFADLGLEDADSLMIRAEIGISLHSALETKYDDPEFIARLLGASDAEVKTLVAGDYLDFSEARLFEFLRRLVALVTPQTLAEAANHNQAEPVTA